MKQKAGLKKRQTGRNEEPGAHGGPGVCPSLFSLAVESAAVSSAVQSDYQRCLTVCWAWCSEYLDPELNPAIQEGSELCVASGPRCRSDGNLEF
ncbi:hypothetical protein PI126_g15201 [Phytophthora idaei]|nr:hypothetical protein PI126_g15201 [Phytophthora idaei]